MMVLRDTAEVESRTLRRVKQRGIIPRGSVIRQSNDHLTTLRHQAFHHAVFLRSEAVEGIDRDRPVFKQTMGIEQLSDLRQRIQRIHIALLHDRVICVINERAVAQLL